MAPFGTLLTTTAHQNPRVLRIHAAAAINGLELEVPPNFELGVTNRSPEYLARFPLGKIPGFYTPSGFNLSESNAIAYYVAESGPKREQLLGSNVEERALVHQWVFFAETQLSTTLTSLLLPLVGRVPFDQRVHEEKAAELDRWLKYLESHLENRNWLVNDSKGPSLGDICVATPLIFAFMHYVDAEIRASIPNIMAWFSRLISLPELKPLLGETKMIEKRVVPTA